MIELCGVQTGYHKKTVLRGIDLTFRPGEVLVLVGPNGCGKSTLLRTALGLMPCWEGQVRYDGVPLERLTLRWRL